MVKRFFCILILIFAVISFNVSGRTEISLNGNWKSVLIPEGEKNAFSTSGKNIPLTSLDDSHWKTVVVPHNWDQYYGYRRMKHGNLHGTAWYRKWVDVPTLNGRQRCFIFFEGAGSYATVYVNGKEIGSHKGGRTTFTVDVTDALLHGKKNLIAVKTDEPSMITDLPWVCGGCSGEWGFSEGSQPLGIFRPVTMVITDEIRIQPFGVHLWNEKGSIRNDGAEIKSETTVKNYGKGSQSVSLKSTLLDPDGKQVAVSEQSLNVGPGDEKTICQVSSVKEKPALWSPANPNLYTMVTTISEGSKVVDKLETTYGIRTISWPQVRNDGDRRFLVNGEPVFINGTCEYEHLLGSSHSFSDMMIRSRAAQIKAAGFNAFRDAHQPHNLLYYKLWDKLGVLCWTQFSAHIWYDTPEFRKNFKDLLKDWVIERRNDPSVILWGLQNESSLPADFAKECTELVRQLDPTASKQRLVTTCNGGEGTDWNVIQNWSGTYGGNPDEYGKELSTQLLNGEYGAWRSIDLHTEGGFIPKGLQSEDRMCSLMEKKIRLAEQNRDSLCGHFIWVFNSHENPGRIQNEEGYREIDRIGPCNYKGLETPWGEPLDVFYLYRSNYAPKEKEPMVYIVSHTWPDRWTEPGIKNDIEVYSNCDSVELFNDFGGKSLGIKVKQGIGTHFQWDNVYIGYNVLYAVGYVKGRQAAKDCIILHHLPQAPGIGKFSWMQSGNATERNVSFKGSSGYKYIYRINCGGPDYKDVNGHEWLADRNFYSNPGKDCNFWGSLSWTNAFSGLNPYLASQRYTNDPVSGTKDWKLFQTFRYGTDKLRYRFPVKPGKYIVELYFIEPWYGTGGGMDCSNWRNFDVAVNGVTMIANLDIWKEAGHDAALKKTLDVDIKGNVMEISFPIVRAGQAIISAIAIATKDKSVMPANPAPGLTGDVTCDGSVCSIKRWLSTGDRQYFDNPVTFSKIPPALYGADWIQARNISARRHIKLNVLQNSLIYLICSEKDTLHEGFEKTEFTVENSGKEVCRIFNKTVKKGSNIELNLPGSSVLAFVPEVVQEQEPDTRPDLLFEAEDAVREGQASEVVTFSGKPCVSVSKTGKFGIEWNVNPGLAGVYAMRFRYRNLSGKTLNVKIQVVSSNGVVLKDDILSFPETGEKWKVLSTTTGTYVNAGKYGIRLLSDDAEGLWLDSMNFQ